MNRSPFCEIKYMNRLSFFSKAGYITWVDFKRRTPTPVPKLPRVPPPPHTHNRRGYERVYKFKEQYMNRSTFCEIKYMNRLGCFFSKAVYMTGIGFKRLTRTPVPTLPRVPPHPHPFLEFKTFHFLSMSIVCNYIFATSCPNYAQWMTRYHLDILYSDEAYLAACAMLEKGAMSITNL